MSITIENTSLLIDGQYLREPSPRDLAQVLESAAPMLQHIATSHAEGEHIAYIALLGTELEHILTPRGVERLISINLHYAHIHMADLQVWVQDLCKVLLGYGLNARIANASTGYALGMHLTIVA